VKRSGRPAFETIQRLVKDERFAGLRRGEQRALLMALSTLGGDETVAFLKELIVQPNLMRDKTKTFHRQIAFEALAANPGEKARQLLRSLARSLRPELRRQAGEALRSLSPREMEES
jgi:hypothetical protein